VGQVADLPVVLPFSLRTLSARSVLKLAVELAGLRLPFLQGLNTAAELGFDGVEIDARGELNPGAMSQTALRQVRKLLADRDLRVAAVVFRTRRGYAATEDLDRRVAGTKAAMQLASQLGAPVVVNSLGPIPAEDDSERRRMLVEVLDDLGRFGNRVGAILTAETGMQSGEELARLLAQLPEGSLGVDFNPGKLLLSGFSPADAVAALGPWILHVHASDARRGLAAGLGEPAAIGRGDADFPALLAALDEHGYRGYFTLQQTPGGDPIRELADAVAQFRRLAP
jgi:sugar phosphate isomerase/epimerase